MTHIPYSLIYSTNNGNGPPQNKCTDISERWEVQNTEIRRNFMPFFVPHVHLKIFEWTGTESNIIWRKKYDSSWGVEFCRPMEETPVIKRILVFFCPVFGSDFQNSILYDPFRPYMQVDIFPQHTSWFSSQTPVWPAWFPSIQILIRVI